jgi:two-component system, cell cycle sensor histidine kinase and response regulator CckA
MAVLGKEGYFLGKDYRGEEVASVLLPVPDSSWFMVAKVDASEAFAEWRVRSLLMLALFLGLAGCVAGSGIVLWQRYKKAHYRALYHAESTLRKNIELHSVTLKSIGDAVISTDAQGRVELLNAVAETLTGWTQADAQGKPLAEVFNIINENTREIVESPTVRVLREGIVIGLANHTILISRDGSERPIADSGAPIRDEHGKIIGVVLVFRDQTSERAAQESLRKSEMRYRQTLDGMHEGCQIIGPDWKYIYVNDAAAQHGRKKREELIGRTMMQAYPGIETTPIFALLTQCMQERCSVRKDNEFVFSDNSRGFFELSIEPIPEGLFILTLDITERIHAERSLKESETRFRTLFEISADGILIADSATKRFLYTNPAICRFLGYTEEELTSMTPADIHPKDMLPVILAEFEALSRGERSLLEDIPCVQKNGAIVYADINAVVINIDGQSCAAGFFRDITPRKHAEAERAKLQAQFIQAQKMESVGRLAGGVAHDYNNILSIILGNAEMAIAQTASNDTLQENLEEIYRAAIRSRDITRQLLAFARKEIIAPEVIDLNAKIEQMLKMLRRLVGEDIDVIWHPSARIRPVLMDPSQLDQILINLCVNAREAIADTGSVIIETEAVTFAKEYCDEHAGFVPGDFIMVSVSDDGCGMDRETREKIFEPFFTTKGMGQGTGLGLATIYGIVKQNNGFINVYSEPGSGTTFKIYLPGDNHKAVPDLQKTVTVIPEGQGELLLIVEDDPSILKMTERILKNKNYTVLAAKNPSEALQWVEAYADKIALLLTDVVMPGMNGRELAERIKSICPKIRCLFMSGYTANVIAHRGVLDKGLDYIQKPFSMQDLMTKIRAILDQ